jgi:hypothetical protein
MRWGQLDIDGVVVDIPPALEAAVDARAPHS